MSECLNESRADRALDLERFGELAAVERDIAPLLAVEARRRDLAHVVEVARQVALRDLQLVRAGAPRFARERLARDVRATVRLALAEDHALARVAVLLVDGLRAAGRGR